MGGFSSGSGNPFVDMAMSLTQMSAQGRQAKDSADQQEEMQNQQAQILWQEQEQRAKQRRDLLKRQMASARAALGGGGVGIGGGSGAALLAGMTRQAEQDIADDYESTNTQHQLRFASRDRKPSMASMLMQNMEQATPQQR